MSLTTLVPAPARQDMNTGLSPVKHQTMISALGVPGAKTTDCSGVTNPSLKAMIATQNVGPFHATGLKPALADLAAIFADVQTNAPDLYHVLGTAGMLCCRLVRGSSNHFSNHSWGTAIDMKIAGVLTPFNAQMIPQGLLDLYPFFHKRGWFWAAGYNGRTDPMHFEVADQTILDWKRTGRI